MLELDPGIALGIRIVDIKDNEVETPNLTARRIGRITQTLGEGRFRHVHPDCGLWMLQREVADRKLRALVQGSVRGEEIAA